LIDIIYRDVYTKRFPELESLVVQPLEYLMTAKELGNQIENVKNNETLQQFLTQVFYLLFYVWLLVRWSRQRSKKL
jgi:U4/U6 small nuclear ribonucleoprotein PRP31